MRSIRDRRAVEQCGGDVKTEADRFAAEYEGKSEAELMSSLMQKVAASKQAGTFSKEEIDDFVRFVSPGLDEGQRARLKELVKLITGE